MSKLPMYEHGMFSHLLRSLLALVALLLIPWGFLFFPFFYKIFNLFLFLVALGLRCCSWAFSSCGERGLLFVVVRRLLIAVASLVAELML